MTFIKVLIVSLLVVINCCSCGQNQEKDISNKLTLKKDLKINSSLEEVFLTAMIEISQGEARNPMILVKKDGNIIFPGGKGKLPKNIEKALTGQKSLITIPKGTNLQELTKIINEKFAINGRIENNNFVIDVK